MKLSIKEWDQKLRNSTAEEIKELLKLLEADERQGAKKLFTTYTNRLIEEEAELRRLEIMCIFEKQCTSKGKKLIAGVDEVGRGP